jgi:hypothetical protein
MIRKKDWQIRRAVEIFMIWVQLSRIQGFRVLGSGFWVQGSGFKVQGSGFKVQGSRFKVSGIE